MKIWENVFVQESELKILYKKKIKKNENHPTLEEKHSDFFLLWRIIDKKIGKVLEVFLFLWSELQKIVFFFSLRKLWIFFNIKKFKGKKNPWVRIANLRNFHFINGEKWWVGMGFQKAGKSQPFFFCWLYIKPKNYIKK
jgi:hypothetical protein